MRGVYFQMRIYRLKQHWLRVEVRTSDILREHCTHVRVPATADTGKDRYQLPIGHFSKVRQTRRQLLSSPFCRNFNIQHFTLLTQEKQRIFSCRYLEFVFGQRNTACKSNSAKILSFFLDFFIIIFLFKCRAKSLLFKRSSTSFFKSPSSFHSMEDTKTRNIYYTCLFLIGHAVV
jgi:hypothetical protein